MQEDRIKFIKWVQEMKELIRGIVVKNQDKAHCRVANYYLMRSLQLLVNSCLWVSNPQVSPPEGDKLDNRKLSVSYTNIH